MKRLGTVLVFKEGVTREEAVDALRQMGDLLEIQHTNFDKSTYSLLYKNLVASPYVNMVKEYDDEYGDPVWYIP